MNQPSRSDLLRDHAAIEMLSARLASLVETDAASDTLAHALGDLVRTVDDHLQIEDAIIYTLAMDKRGDAAADVERSRSEFERLKSDWNGYLRLWSADEIAHDRETFTQATRAMLPRLRDRVRLETDLLSQMTMNDFPQHR